MADIFADDGNELVEVDDFLEDYFWGVGLGVSVEQKEGVAELEVVADE